MTTPMKMRTPILAAARLVFFRIRSGSCRISSRSSSRESSVSCCCSPGFPDIFSAAVRTPEQVVRILKSAVRADHIMYSSVSVRRLVVPRGLNIL